MLRPLGQYRYCDELRSIRSPAHKPERIHLDVELSMITAPADAKSVKVWVDVMLSERQGYFTLIDGGTARLDTKETYGTPRH
jgi:hypothetical protein